MVDVLGFLASFAGIAYLSTHISRSSAGLARRYKEPYGTLIVTLTALTLQSILLAILMLDGNHMTLVRDTLYSVVMLQLGGAVGFGLLVAGSSKVDQRFNRGINTYLAALALALVLPMIAPNYIPEYVRNQWVGFCALVLILVYCGFLLMQVRRPKPFIEYRAAGEDGWDNAPVWQVAGMLVGLMVAVGFLAVLMSRFMDNATAVLGLPYGVVGAFVAFAATAPEIRIIIRGTLRNHLPTAINVAIGSALASVVLTIPVILVLANLLNFELVLELTGIQIALMASAIVMTFMVTQEGEANVLGGAVLISLFLVFLFHSFFI